MAVPDLTTSGMISFSNGRPVDFLFQAEMPLGDQLGLAGDGGRLARQLDLGLFDGEHELVSCRAN